MALIDLDLDPGRQRLASFGRFAAVAFAALAAVLAWRHALLGMHVSADAARVGTWILGALAVACAALSWLAPRALRPLWIALSVAAYPIGWVVSHVVLALLYFGILTPIGLVFRLIRRDPLAREFDRSATTYWIRRPAPADPRRYYRQF